MYRTKKEFVKNGLSLLIIFIFLVNCTGGESSSYETLIKIDGFTMGTTYMVKIVPSGERPLTDLKKRNESLTNDIEAILKNINQQMSIFKQDSEISRFNRYQENEWFNVSADTASVISQSKKISAISNGAFDITAGPLINLWGFGSAGKKKSIPDQQQIDEIKEKIGHQKLYIRIFPPAIKKEFREIQCNLSAIAKGFGVDKIAKLLDKEKLSNYLVEIGGEVKAKGTNQQNEIWRVGVAAPDGTYSIKKIISLKDKAMATSGDYQNYFEEDGVRYSHTIDPATGRPITHKLASVTVIHSSCMKADALATAINVLGPKKGYELAIRENLPVYMIIKKDDLFIDKMTPQFKSFLHK